MFPKTRLEEIQRAAFADQGRHARLEYARFFHRDLFDGVAQDPRVIESFFIFFIRKIYKRLRD